MESPILDLSFLFEISDNDGTYISEVIGLFLDSVPDAIRNLGKLIDDGTDFEAIQRQAHFLKSSTNIIKIRDMHGYVAGIESLARAKTGLAEMKVNYDLLAGNFKIALPLILEEKAKAEAQQG